MLYENTKNRIENLKFLVEDLKNKTFINNTKKLKMLLKINRKLQKIEEMFVGIEE